MMGAGPLKTKLVLLLTSGIIAWVFSKITGAHFSFVWYITAILMGLGIGAVWAASELWKDYGPKRN